jgi:RNA polymerase subunit RPABC4/transcription elongation factor Spt4
MYLYHASDLHITNGLTIDGIPLTIGGKTFQLRQESDANTRFTAEAVVDYFARLLHRGNKDWHLVITGDITDVGAEEEFDYAREILAPIWDPRLLTVIPGNHDCSNTGAWIWAKSQGFTLKSDFEARRARFRQVFGELMQSAAGYRYGWPFVKPLTRQGIVLVGLDSCDDNNVLATGRLCGWQLERLDKTLDRIGKDRRFKDYGVYVLVHHSPLDSSDKMGLEDGEELLDLCAHRVTAVLNGHRHVSRVDWNKTPVLQAASPSLAESDRPLVEVDEVEVARYRLHSGDIRSLDDIEDVSIPLAPAIRSRQSQFRSLYSHQFRKAVACDDCGGPITPEMAYCPWCASETDFSDTYSLVCEECAQPLMPGYDYCPWCGEETGNGQGAYSTDRMKVACPECTSGVEVYHHNCPYCGEEQLEPDDDHPGSCENCGWPVDEDVYRFCPWCGDEL